MKMTLISMVQNILSSLSSDEVNSYSDTTESMQVAEIIRTTYFNIIARAQLPDQEQIFQLDASTDSALPILMYRPDNVSRINWLKYYNVIGTADNTVEYVHDLDLDISATPSTIPPSPSFGDIKIVTVAEYIAIINNYNTSAGNVVAYTFNDGGSKFNLFYKNDKYPEYCTILNNYYILFDSFDNSVDDTLQTSKTMAYGETIPTFVMDDRFIPVLDDGQFPLLLSEAKSLAFMELKQMTHSKAEQETRRQWATVQKTKSLADKPSYFDQLPNFGRHGSGRIE